MAKNQKLLYRYRAPEKYNIDAFLSDCINGSLLSAFTDVGELNFGIPNGRFSKYGATIEDEQKMVSSIVENAKHHYYMACLTYNHIFDSFILIPSKKFDCFELFLVIYPLPNCSNTFSLDFFPKFFI